MPAFVSHEMRERTGTLPRLGSRRGRQESRRGGLAFIQRLWHVGGRGLRRLSAGQPCFDVIKAHVWPTRALGAGHDAVGPRVHNHPAARADRSLKWRVGLSPEREPLLVGHSPQPLHASAPRFSDLLVTACRFRGLLDAATAGQHRVRLRNPPRGVAPSPELRLGGWPVFAEGFLSVRGLRREP